MEGELKDFNILEVIQLLAQQGKTGVLRVWGLGKKEDEAGIYFFTGKITHATSTQRSRGDLLGERLAKTGLISRQDLEEALRTQKKSGRFLGEIVVEGGMVDEKSVLNAIHTQVHELVYELFRMEGGRFKFEPLPGDVFPKVTLQLNADEVMLNILKMVDEWPQMEKKLPPPNAVLQKTGALEGHGIELTEAHAAVYRLVDGKRSVQEIVDMSVLGKFATLEILVSLLEGGDIKEIGVKRAAMPPEVKGVVAPPVRDLRLRYAIGGALAFLLLMASFYPFRLDFLWQDVGLGGEGRAVYEQRVRKERRVWGEKAFFLIYGRYPERPEELVEAGILTQEDLKGGDVGREDSHP